jgi:hypothetical protein
MKKVLLSYEYLVQKLTDLTFGLYLKEDSISKRFNNWCKFSPVIFRHLPEREDLEQELRLEFWRGITQWFNLKRKKKFWTNCKGSLGFYLTNIGIQRVVFILEGIRNRILLNPEALEPQEPIEREWIFLSLDEKKRIMIEGKLTSFRRVQPLLQ